MTWTPPSNAVEAGVSPASAPASPPAPASVAWSPPADAVAVDANANQDNPDNTEVAAGPNVGPRNITSKAGTFKYDPSKDVVSKFLGNVEAGAVKSFAGIAQTAADTLGLGDLGTRIKGFSDIASATLTQGQDHGGIAQSVGQMLPYVLGGEAAGIAKGGGMLARAAASAASGAIAGGTTLQDGDNSGDRNWSRLKDAGAGAMIGAATGLSSDVAGTMVTKLANSKTLTKVFDSIKGTIDDWKPSAAEVNGSLRSHFDNLTSQYDQRMKRFSGLVASLGGVPSEGIVPQVKAATATLGKIAKSDPAKGFLSEVVTTLQHVMPQPGRDAMQSIPMGGGAVLAKDAPEALKASLRKAGLQIDDTPPKPGDAGQIAQLSQHIDDFLEKHGGNVSSQASIALRDVKGSLDMALDGVKQSNPAVARVWNGIKTGYLDVIKPLNQGTLKGLLNSDPQVQTDTLTNMFKNGDTNAAATLASMVSPKAKDQVVQTAIHQGVAQSFDKVTNHIDGSKFSAYFNDPNVKNTLKPFLTDSNSGMLKGVQNLLRADAHAKPGKGFFGSNPGSFAASFGLFEGIKKIAEGEPFMGAKTIGASILGAAGVKLLTHSVDKLIETVPGRNFFNAAGTVNPDSPQWTKLVDQWRPRLTAVLGTIWAQEYGKQGQTQSPPGP